MASLNKDKPITIKTGLGWVMYLALGGHLVITNVHAQAIAIENASLSLQDNTYYLNAALSLSLGQEAKKALEHGISLHLNMMVRIKQARPWLWDKKVADRLLNYQLQYHPLSGNYIVTSINDQTRRSFKILNGALRHLGAIKNVPCFDKMLLVDKRDYIATMRAYLDIESLPAPMRPVAYLSSDWHISGAPYAWTLNP